MSKRPDWEVKRIGEAYDETMEIIGILILAFIVGVIIGVFKVIFGIYP